MKEALSKACRAYSSLFSGRGISTSSLRARSDASPTRAEPPGGQSPDESGGIALHRKAGQSPPPCLLEAQKGERPYKIACFVPPSERRRSRRRGSGACDRKPRRRGAKRNTSYPAHNHLSRRSDHTKRRFCLTAQPRRLAAAERSRAKRGQGRGRAEPARSAQRARRRGGARPDQCA